jgi:hypothetical protein
MGETRHRMNPLVVHALDKAGALLRDPAIRAALDILDDMAEADRAHSRAQARLRQRAAELAASAGQKIDSLERLRRLRPTLVAFAGGPSDA